MTKNEITKLTDKELEEQKLYYENRKAGFKEYHDEYMIADRVLYDINKEVQQRASAKDVGKCFKHKYENIYICLIGNSAKEHCCLFLEEDYDISVGYIKLALLTRNSDYAEIPKEEFLKQYAIAVNHLLNNIDPNISMVFKKEDVNDND